MNIENKTKNQIKYGVEIQTPFKLIENKHIFKIFIQSLNHFKYNLGELDFDMNNENSIELYDWKGMTGHKNNQVIKLYSKLSKKDITSNFDTIRLELTSSNRKQAKNELLELISYCEEFHLKSVNRFSKQSKDIISMFKKILLE